MTDTAAASIEHTVISEDDFFERYIPVNTPGTEPNSGEFYHEFEHVKGLDPHNVWTIVDGDDGGMYAIPGFHIVNRVCYVVTEKPWETGLEEALWMEPSEDLD